MPMQYQPLSETEDQIRLLVPLPDKSRLSFSLHHVALDVAEQFWAFSYTWGDRTDSVEIIVNGETLEITVHLYIALLDHITLVEAVETDVDLARLQQIIPNRYIWVDAICINQHDHTERARQLRLMQAIYKKALVAVHLDLGETATDSMAHSMILDIWRQYKEGRTPTITEEAWPVLCAFFSKSWFKRTWVIQEFILAKLHPSIIWVRKRLVQVEHLRIAAWQIFRNKAAASTLPDIQATAMLDGIKEFLALVDLKYTLESSRPPNLLLYLLWQFRDRKVTDPRDKIYALLGLLEEHRMDSEGLQVGSSQDLDMSKLIIDYEAPVEEVFASLVIAMISASKSLNVICACQNTHTFRRSWVPDFTQPWSKLSLLMRNIYSGFTMEFPSDSDMAYRASGDQKAEFHYSDDSREVTVQGIAWASMLSLTPHAKGFADQKETFTTWAIDIFNELPPHVRLLFERIYEDKLMEYSTQHAWIMAALGGDFSEDESRGLHYKDFFVGASPEWLEGARNFEQRNYKGEDVGFIDVRALQMGRGRNIFIGSNGYGGLVPDHAELGDLVCVLLGCDVPVVLRQVGDKYIFVGEAYVHNLMHGEAVDALREGKVEATSFTLI